MLNESLKEQELAIETAHAGVPAKMVYELFDTQGHR